MDPANSAAHVLIGIGHTGRRRFDAAIAEFEKALASSERYSSTLGRLGYAYAMAGKTSKARALLAEIESQPNAAAVHGAFICAGLGDKARAMELLQKAATLRESEAIFVAVEPLLDGLRGDPQFRALLKNMGLPTRRL